MPDDDLTTLRTSLYLVAKKKLSSDLMANFTQTLMKVRRDLLREEPIFAQITAPSTDADAYLPLHPGAAAFYNGTQQSFMDEYGNYIYLGPMILGGIAIRSCRSLEVFGDRAARNHRRPARYALRVGTSDTERWQRDGAVRHRRQD